MATFTPNGSGNPMSGNVQPLKMGTAASLAFVEKKSISVFNHRLNSYDFKIVKIGSGIE